MTVNRTGAASIVDRREGWGHKSGTDINRKDDDNWDSAIVANDASPEDQATRLGKQLRVRNSFSETNDPAIVDRVDGEVTRQDIEDAKADYRNGIYVDKDGNNIVDDLEFDDADVTIPTNGTEALATGRTSTALPTSDLVPPGIDTVGSIVDRTDGWGHKDGTQGDRKDS